MGQRYVPLFWRLFIPNATVLGAACVVLIVEPAHGRVVALVGGLVVLLAVNVVLMRRAFAPLAGLMRLMAAVDPLRPGQRVAPPRQDSEVAVLAHAFNGMLDRLESERRDSGRRALTEREEERRRLAAELHDELGQSLTALALQLDRLVKQPPEGVSAELRQARDGVLEAVEAVRGLARGLRPEALDTLGLVAALHGLIDRLSSRTGLKVRRHLERSLPDLSPEAELVIYRTAQESLTNVVRHAQAACAEVRLGARPGGVELCVRDDGVGIEGHLEDGGIRGMRERAILVGGDFTVGARGDRRGTEVRLAVAERP